MHSALSQIYYGGQNFVWVIQGDISKCFDNIPHEIITKLVRSKIVDQRFLELINKFLQTGIIDPETGKAIGNHIGIPQGGILSPILCNIVLHQFDEYMYRMSDKFKKGRKRAHNLEYQRLEYRRRKANTMQERRRLLLEMRRIGNVDKFDPNFRRLKYIRYADDFIIMTIGTKDEANMIKNNSKVFLKVKCGVKLNDEKTIITNMTDGNFKFLGAEISTLKINPTFLGTNKSNITKVATNRPLLKAPIKSLLEKMKTTGFIRQDKFQIYRPKYVGFLLNLSHYDIIAFYNSKIQ